MPKLISLMKLIDKTKPSCLTLLVLMFSASLSADALNPYGCQFRDMEAFYKRKLGIETVHVEYRYVRVKDSRTQGYAQQTGKSRYRITLANWLENSELRITLAHELIHVRQLERGQIDLSEFEKHYLDRSFEDEAFRLSIPMAADFYTHHKCNNSDARPKKPATKKPGHND